MIRPTFLYRISHRLHEWHVPLLPGLLRRVNFLICHADIPPGCRMGRNVEFAHWGLGVVLNEVVEIGDNVLIYQHVTIGRSRGIIDDNPGFLKKITIGDNTLIGAGAIILAKKETLSIGRDCEVAAGAVVIDDVPDGMMAVGAPARVLPRKHKN